MYQDNPFLQDPQQLQHFKQHLSAIVNYFQDSQQLYTVQQQTLVGLPQQLKQQFRLKSQKLKELAHLNQQFLIKILPQHQYNLFPTTANNISKIRSTIRQFYRQWCEESQQKQKYIQILQLFRKYKKSGKVLIPGCGLGRIVLQFVMAGYQTQGNQVSYFMLFGSQFILNQISSKNQCQIAPFIHNLAGYKAKNDVLRTVKIPDIVASQKITSQSQFSMRAGQFIDVYEKQLNNWDGVVTCFFIDTAMNIFKYVDTIHKILKDDGIWVNYGPLLFHFRDNLKQQSVQISWDTLKKYIQTLFTIKQQYLDQTTYCHDPKSSSKLVYRCIKFIAIKK